jgi:cyclohexanecarboxyl-CoA dehydrogenase
MDFGISDTQALFREQVAEFVSEEIRGENLDWDDGDNFPWEVYRDLGDMGLLGMSLPEDAGGSDLDAQTTGHVFEELGRGDVALTMLVMVQNIANYVLVEHGDEHHREVGEANARGENVVAWAITEPDRGSDAGSVQTRAEVTDDGFLVNGEKTAITGSTFGDYMVLYARRPDLDEIRPFLVPFDAEGVSVQAYHGMGGRVSGWGQVFFDDVALEEAAMITDESGFLVAMDRFDVSRGWIPLYCLGAAQQTVDETIEYLKEREAFGQPLANYQGPQFEIAEMATRLESARLKAYEALWKADQGEDFTKDASMAKWFGTQTAQEVLHDCIVLHGHYGYSDDFGLSKRFQDIIGLEIGEGPHQVQKVVISREMIGKEYRPY